jgi:hypothetical protein
MEGLGILDVLKLISGGLSSILLIFGFLVGIFKPLRTWFYNKIKRVANIEITAEAITDIRTSVTELKRVFETQIQASEIRDAATASMIRNEITKMYYTYLEKRAMPAREKENMLRLYESYANLGGNSYISAIVDEMMRWETY